MGESTGPRVVRTASTSWGLPSLALREIKQILIGNQLMLFSICIMVELCFTGGTGALEHPAMPAKTTSASIWRTPLMELLLSLPEFSSLEFAQGLLGTMMLTLRLTSDLQMARSGRLAQRCKFGAGNRRELQDNDSERVPPRPLRCTSHRVWALSGLLSYRRPCTDSTAIRGHLPDHEGTALWRRGRARFCWWDVFCALNLEQWPRRKPPQAKSQKKKKKKKKYIYIYRTSQWGWGTKLRLERPTLYMHI